MPDKATATCPTCQTPLIPFQTGEGAIGPGDRIDDPVLEWWDNMHCETCGRDYRVNRKTGVVAEMRGRS